MKKPKLTSLVAGSAMLFLSGASHAVVTGDLLTGNAVTTAWQNCDGSDLIAEEGDDQFDVAHLEGSGCVYRETIAQAGEEYKMTCGVSSSKYSSITLAFQNDAGETLATETTEIYEDVRGGAYSVTLTAPAGTTMAAVGIYGLRGSGFQDCTLLRTTPEPEPVDGSISGVAWFDRDENSERVNSENLIPSTPVSLYYRDEPIRRTETNLDGKYYFGGLDIDLCYTVHFLPADPTLTFGAAGGDNDITGEGRTLELCPTEAAPNIIDVDAAFIAVPPVLPPEDYAVCGAVYVNADNTNTGFPSVELKLVNTVTGDGFGTTTLRDGSYSFSNLPAGDYQLSFSQPAGFEFVDSGTPLVDEGSYANENGDSPQFNLPTNSNTGADDACTLDNANAVLTRTVVALDPTVAVNDEVDGMVGDTLVIQITDNDVPCNGEVLEVDMIGHNVPGDISYNPTTGEITISNTTQSGTYSIQYGLRGTCGSYGTAVVTVTLNPVPPPPPPEAPEAPRHCFASIGKGTGLESGVHIDIKLVAGETHAILASQYNFYDVDMNLVYTGLASEAGRPSWGLYWRKREHGVEVLDIKYATAVENGVESTLASCARQHVTPIALDVDKSGAVEHIAGDFAFDMDGDGIDENLMQWFAPTDGILIRKDFGTEINGEHLFGDTGRQYSDGFAKLSLEDVNGDGQLVGKELENLAIWTDINSNTMVDAGEISTISSHSIEALSVQHYKYSARATLSTGKTMLMRDVLFSIRPITQAAK
jgi:hypothetical protein